MLGYFGGFWEGWLNPHKVTFDGLNKLILINPGVTYLDIKEDIYSDWKEWVTYYNGENAKWAPAMRSVGGDPITQDLSLGSTFFLLNGWRIKPWDGHTSIHLYGNLYVDEGGSPIVPDNNGNSSVALTVSNLVDTVVIDKTSEVTSNVNVVSVAGEAVTGVDDLKATPLAFIEALLNTNIHAYNTTSTVGDALHRLTYLEQRVYVNTELDTNGDGSQSTPYNNFQDAKDECEQRGISAIVLIGDITLSTNLKNFNIFGIGNPRIDTNGQDCRNTTFHQCSLTGDYLNKIVVYDCILENGLGLNGHFYNCSLQGTVHAIQNGSALLAKCQCGFTNAQPAVISMNAQAPSQLNVQAFSGGLTIINSDHVDDEIVVDMAQGILTFDASNVAGTMNACGNCRFIDQTNGATVTDDTIGLRLNEISDEIHTRLLGSADAFMADVDTPVVAAKAEILDLINQSVNTIISQMLPGWETDEVNNQLVYYDDNGVEIARFNCFDGNGSPSVTAVRRMALAVV